MRASVAAGQRGARARGQQRRRRVHANLGQHRIARMGDVDPEALFAALHLGEFGIIAKARMVQREPGHGRHHARLDLAAGHQVAQAGFHEDAVARFLRVGVQRAEGQNLHVDGRPVRRA
jgi:hypothetical protein